jgi:hypothetical protein
MPEGVGILLLCALVIGLPGTMLIGAVFLRAAVALYNKMAGGASSPSRVPEPAFGQAMLFSFWTCVVQLAVGLIIAGVLRTGTGATAPGAGKNGDVVVAQLISFPVNLLIMAEMLSAILPTTFGRAILVTLCYMLTVILVTGVMVAIVVVLFGVVLRGS